MKMRPFNMIEVLLALAITAVGITGLMGIIPLGLNANRDAMAETFTADIANSYFAELSRKASKASDFKNFCNSSIPFAKQDVEDSDEIDGKKYPVYKRPVTPAPDDWEEGGKIEYQHKFEENGVDFDDSKVGTKGYIRVFVGKKDGTNKVTPDFVADLCGWKCYPDDIPDVDNADVDGKRNLIRVYLEVSWPVTAAYDNREKRIFVREFYDKKGLVEEAP